MTARASNLRAFMLNCSLNMQDESAQNPPTNLLSVTAEERV
jgi:hypothetical protein